MAFLASVLNVSKPLYMTYSIFYVFEIMVNGYGYNINGRNKKAPAIYILVMFRL